MGKHTIINDAKDMIQVDKKGYYIYRDNCQIIMKKLKEGKYDGVRNYYKEAREAGDLDREKPYARELNRILWGFLRANKKSKKDLQILDTAIAIFLDTISTLESIENSKPVSEYLYNHGYKSYVDFAQYLNNKYGIDAKEYQQAKSNGFKINEQSSEDDLLYGNEPIYNSSRMTEAILSILKNNKKELLKSSDFGYSILEHGLKQKEIYPIYKQNYGLPPLQVIKSTKVVLEFSILDDKKYIDHMLKEAYGKEKRFHRITSSSEKSRLLSAINHKEEKFVSINMLQKALILYQYTQDGEEVLDSKDAWYIFIFHAFLFAYSEKSKTTDMQPCKNLVYRSRDVITYSVLKNEIKKQTEIIESLLNLTH
ncbi:hypothetical protein [Sulfurovum sp. NBC37-1]|uniref:hypothetical protein n=1 Tax=Sulfurovum sp. (strain NBC37-1) TaxID=387093 RepID=UPI000158797C|nr:hypothetical protein [Sulfurovum sp. NBC37-1]BAF73235.1 hypothetical protein SUN_2295 [Sulfurovum sp. NBC37-1]